MSYRTPGRPDHSSIYSFKNPAEVERHVREAMAKGQPLEGIDLVAELAVEPESPTEPSTLLSEQDRIGRERLAKLKAKGLSLKGIELMLDLIRPTFESQVGEQKIVKAEANDGCSA